MEALRKPQPRILWISSDAPDECERAIWNRLSRYSPIVCRAEQQVIDILRTHEVGAVLANGPARQCDPLALLAAIRSENGQPAFFVRNAQLPVSLAITLIRGGAKEVFGAEADHAAVATAVQSAVNTCKDVPEHWRTAVIGQSHAMHAICATVELIAQRRGTVLITGETGTGKEVIARAIHSAGKRASHPFVAVNCSAIPGTLLESELFGYVRGAFTGANSQHAGRFEQAQHGTLFLDEIGDLSPDLQAKLLRVLQDREIQRLGSSETVRLDVRVIAATHIDLPGRIREGTFREDLYYRLNVIPLELPPLRARKTDVPLLIDYFLRKICAAEELPLRRITESALMRLVEYSWPGNIRQLENTMERAIALSGNRILLDDGDFDRLSPPKHLDEAALHEVPEGQFDYEEVVSRFEWNLLSQALRKSGGNKQAAADLLGLKRTTLAAKVKVLCPTADYTVM